MPRLALTVAVFAAVPAPAHAAFVPPVKLGTGPVRQAAVAAGDRAAVAWADGVSVRFAVRESSGWTERTLARWQHVRDLRVARNERGTVVVAWTGFDEGRPKLGVASSRPSGTLARHFPLAGRSLPVVRLAASPAGHVLIALRDGRRALETGRVTSGARLEDMRTVAKKVGSIAIASGPATTAVAWTEGRPSPRAVRAMRLTSTGRPAGPAALVGRDVNGEVQLAVGDRPLVSWTRRPTASRPQAAFTRSLHPALRPARPFGAQGTVPYGAPYLAMDAAGRAVAAAKMATSSPFGTVALAGLSRSGGVWSSMRALGRREPMISQPQPVLPAGGRPLVLFARPITKPSPPPGAAVTYEVVACDNLGAPVAIGSGFQTSDGRGLGVDEHGGDVAAGWPTADGVRFTEQRSAAS